MDPCLIYPPALCNLHLSAQKRMFQAVPITAGLTSDRRIRGTHFHDFLQIWYTVSGSYIHTVEGVAYKQTPGSAMLVFPYMKHAIDTSMSDFPATTIICVSIKKGFLEKNLVPFLSHAHDRASFDGIPLNPYLFFSGKDKDTADSIFLGILEEYRKQKSMYPPKILSLLVDFLTLCSTYSATRYSKHELLAAERRNVCIDNALDFLSSNITETISLNDASNAATMSRSRFTQSFYEKTGQSCAEHIRMLRMYKAVRMLRYTEKNITEIALECGFCDSSHFSRQCVALYGVPPLRLRRELSQWTRDYGDALYKATVCATGWAVPYDEAHFIRHARSMGF